MRLPSQIKFPQEPVETGLFDRCFAVQGLLAQVKLVFVVVVGEVVQSSPPLFKVRCCQRLLRLLRLQRDLARDSRRLIEKRPGLLLQSRGNDHE